MADVVHRSPSEAGLSVIEDGPLAGRYGSLRRIEQDLRAPVCQRLYQNRLIGLAITELGAAAERSMVP